MLWAGGALVTSLPTFCFLAGGGWVSSLPLGSPVVAVTDSALSRWPAVLGTCGSGSCDSRVELERRKEGRESLFVIWLRPSPPVWDFLWSLLLGAGHSEVPVIALVDEGLLVAEVTSRTAGWASGKLAE